MEENTIAPVDAIFEPTKAPRGHSEEPPADLLPVPPPKIDANATCADVGTIEDAPPITAPTAAKSTQEEVPAEEITASELPADHAPIFTPDTITQADAPIDEPAKETADPTAAIVDGETQGEVSKPGPMLNNLTCR